jgi:CSLREA domain-containing protein
VPLSRFLAAGSVAAVVLAAPVAAHAATITVTTTADAVGPDGACSLREAVSAANADAAIAGPGECAAGSPGATDRIVLAAGLYRRSVTGVGEDANGAGDLDVTGPLEILGAGAAVTIIDARGIDRVIDVRPGGSLRLADVALTGGAAPGGPSAAPATAPPGSAAAVTGGPGGAGEDGGGVRAAGPLTIERSRVSGNAGGDGGAGGDATGGTGTSAVTPGGVGTGGPGGRGGAGAIWSSGGLTLLSTVVSGNRGGAGGPGGAGRGGTGIGGGDPAAGGAAAGGAGGDGGAGAIAAVGEVVIRDSAVLGNQSGDGGAGGDAVGGSAGSGGEGADGGAGTGGAGGSGGPGGGVDVSGPVTIERATVASNTTGRGGPGGDGLGGFGALPEGQAGAGVGGAGGPGGPGGGVVARTNSLTLVNTTLAGNISGPGGGGGGGGFGTRLGPGSAGGAGGAGGPGGALAVTGGAATGSFLTISGNGSGGAGGPGEAGASGSPGAGGAAGAPGLGEGAGIFAAVPTSIAASAIVGNGCAGPGVGDGGANVNQAASGCPGTAGDARLGALAANGGVPPTLQPGAGSAVIDRVPAFVICPATDARGATRPVGGACDVGAYEVAPPVAVTGGATVTGSMARIGGTVTTRGLATGVRVQIGRTASYGTETPLVTVAGDAGPTAIGVTVGGLVPLTTYHYRVVASGPDGTSVGADRTFTVTPPSVAGLGRPRLTRLTVKPKAFAPVPRGGTRTGARKGRPPLGALLSFRLSERASVGITVTRSLRGKVVRAGKRARCVPVSTRAKLRRGRGCIRVQTLGTVRRSGTPGANRFVLTGNVGTRPLAPGTYRLVLVATDPDGQRSAPARVAIRILPSPPPPLRRSATGG